MAEADAKLTGRPGVCFVTRGPGATHGGRARLEQRGAAAQPVRRTRRGDHEEQRPQNHQV